MGSSSEQEGGAPPSARLTVGERFELLVSGVVVDVRSGTARRLLTELAEHRDEMVPHERLADVVWHAGERPVDAVRAVQGQVSRLRRLLGPAAAGIVTERGGYRLRTGAIEVDIDESRLGRGDASLALIGRDAEIKTVADLLASGTIVTLIGPGGVGKTALGVAAIARYGSTYGVPVAVVTLTPAIAARDAPVVVARALGIERLGAEDWVERLVEALSGRPMALLVDDADHVADAAGDLVPALTGGAGLAVLVTCRTPLALPGEIVHPVPPLEAEHAAPELFVRGARAHRPGWQPTGDEMAQIRAICAAVGSRPLGIELAAAQFGSRSLHEIETSLVRAREPIEGVRPIGAPDDGLRAVIDSSSELLDGRRRSCLDQFAVFVGGASAETAAQVCFAPPARPATAARWLEELVDRALLDAAPAAGGSRYSMLDTVRHHAMERLVEGRELREVRLRHAEALLHVVEQAASSMWGPSEAAWVARLDAERADICLAHHTFTRLGEHESAQRVATAAYMCAWPRGWSDLCGLVDESIDEGPEVPSGVRAAALAAAADRANMTGEVQLARQRAERGLALADGQCTPLAHGVLGDVALYTGDVDEAVARWRQAAAGFEATLPGLAPYAAASAALALVYARHADEAGVVADLALVAAGASACPTSAAFARYVAAQACGRSAPDRAAALLAESVAIAGSVRAGFIGNLARTERAALDDRAGDTAAALAAYPAILREWLRLGQWPQLWSALRSLVALLAKAGAREQAATVLGGLRAFGQAVGIPTGTPDERSPELELRDAEFSRSELVLFAEMSAGAPAES